MGVRTKALNLLNAAWSTKTRGMKKMNQATAVRPDSPHQVIRVVEELKGIVKFDFGPVVFNLCERKDDRNPNMYVVVKGSICVAENNESCQPLQTMSFKTQVGYFRRKDDQLEHVYGVHYDMDERGCGHPVFHAQLGPETEFASEIKEQFHFEACVVDCVNPMLRNVRTPTAQMDFFSVWTQLCADHLMSVDETGSDPQVTEGFKDVRSACKVLQGAAHRLTYLKDGKAPKCYRSYHWYGP